jgi:hypothetical protein
LERDRDDELESRSNLDAERSADSRAADGAVRESSSDAARWEPGSDTLKVEQKQNGTERRSPIEAHGAPAAPNGKGVQKSAPGEDDLNAARAIASNALGASARTIEALSESGIYRGSIIGETERYILQRQSDNTAVLHHKQLLDRQPGLGENVAISYSNEKGRVREARARGKAQDLGR